MGVNLWPLDSKPCYLLVPRSMFFEFIPLDHSHEEQPKVKESVFVFLHIIRGFVLEVGKGRKIVRTFYFYF